MFSAELRSSLYAMFSDYFAFPDKADSPLFDQEMLSEAASLLGIAGPPMISAGKTLELQTAYTWLFINRPGGVLAHPYGAVYLESEPRLMGESTRAVLAAYQETGMNPEDSSEPPDSLTLELEFMAHLTDQEARALKAGNREVAESFRKRQGDFSQNYLHPWLFEFCSCVTDDETAHPLYHWGARLLACFGRTEELSLPSRSA